LQVVSVVGFICVIIAYRAMSIGRDGDALRDGARLRRPSRPPRRSVALPFLDEEPQIFVAIYAGRHRQPRI
jgi:hypothetical protein